MFLLRLQCADHVEHVVPEGRSARGQETYQYVSELGIHNLAGYGIADKLALRHISRNSATHYGDHLKYCAARVVRHLVEDGSNKSFNDLNRAFYGNAHGSE